MMRHTKTAVFVSILLALTSALSAQEMSQAEFRKLWNQGVQLEDDKILDKAMKRGSRHAITYYEEFWTIATAGANEDAEFNCEALMASWGRIYENKQTLEKVQEWVDGASPSMHKQLHSIRSNSAKIWNDYLNNVATGLVKKDYQSCYADFVTLAKSAEGIGHAIEAADMWGLASVIGNKMPGKTIDEREEMVFAIEQQISNRENWGYTFDNHYKIGKDFVKSELAKIEADKKDASKRKDEGYDADAKGVEALLMPKVAAKKFPLKFAVLKNWKKDLDYGPRGGPVPQFWWLDSLTEAGSTRKMGWFGQRDMYLIRRGASKYAVNWLPEDGKTAVPISVSPKTKPSTFYLADDKKLPYAMFFWTGTDSEAIGVAQCNYGATSKQASIYYRSASSWKATVGTDPVVFYDDDASGKPGDGEPFKGDLKSHLLGDATGSGLTVPLFDSMKVGKGKRVPYSQFVKLAAGWHYMEIASGADVAIRPLNPEYVKSGTVKLAWKGPKQTAPAQLVIQGRGDYSTAIFDVAGGKEVEVPAGEYSVIWGRIAKGKAPRVITAQIYPTDETKSFVVKAGEKFDLQMGADFTLNFDRDGDRNASISALSICVTEKSGCKITGLHGISLPCTALSSLGGALKGAKEIGEFVPFTNDQLLVKATGHYNNLGFLVATFPMPKGYREGELAITKKFPVDGMKITLHHPKKHKFFGVLKNVWK